MSLYVFSGGPPRRSAECGRWLAMAALAGALGVAGAARAQKLQMEHVRKVPGPLKAVARVNPQAMLDLWLGAPLQDAAGAKQRLKDLYDPASAQFHHFLTPDQYEAQFGPEQASLDRIAAFAKANGMTVVDTPAHQMVHVRATVATLEKAFKLELNTYQHPVEARMFRAPSADPTIPPGVPIVHVTGLDTYVVPKPVMSSIVVVGSGYGPSGPPANSLFGKMFRKIYAADVSSTGAGQVVGIVANNGYFASDITAYEDSAGMTHVPLKTVTVSGFSSTPSGDNTEVSMDIENAISMAPGISQLTVYEAGDTAAMLAEVTHPTQGEPLALQVSTSYTWVYDANIYPLLDRLAIQGQTFFQSSGDEGAFTAYPGLTPFPVTDYPTVVSVGGTVLTLDPSTGGRTAETGWSGSGGGVSPWLATGDTHFALPDYQKGLATTANQASTTARNIPDISMTAANVGVLANNGLWAVVGGTSASSPLWAGFTALVNATAQSRGQFPIGFLNPALYAVGRENAASSELFDVQSGSNPNILGTKTYTAQVGYDLVTGLGTPRGEATIDALLRVSQVQPNCAALKELLASLQKQLAQAQARLRTQLCRGPASFECVQTIRRLQQELGAEMQYYHKECPPPK
jgi:subtilase family serine protease